MSKSIYQNYHEISNSMKSPLNSWWPPYFSGHAAETKDPWRDARPKFMCWSVSVICCGLRWPSGDDVISELDQKLGHEWRKSSKSSNQKKHLKSKTSTLDVNWWKSVWIDANWLKLNCNQHELQLANQQQAALAKQRIGKIDGLQIQWNGL